jgi:hypothetical protein
MRPLTSYFSYNNHKKILKWVICHDADQPARHSNELDEEVNSFLVAVKAA